MEINTTSERPIFLQIAEGIEDAILAGAFAEEEQIPSITEFAVRYNINPATALKGVNLLVDAGIVHKKRGVGMFVSAGAQAMLRQKRKDGFYTGYVMALVAEARRLRVQRGEVKDMVNRAFDEQDASGA